MTDSERADRYRRERLPFFEDLSRAGVAVTSTDLWNFEPVAPSTWQDVLPVAVKYLRVGEYAESTIAGYAALLARRASEPYWDQIAQAYEMAETPYEKESLAAALAKASTKERASQLSDLFLRNRNDRSAILFVRTLLRLLPAEYQQFFESHRSDPVFGVEATRALRRIPPNTQ